jgi:serine/threonine protein phosphatase PrpC
MQLKSFVAQSDQGPFLQTNEDGYDFDVMNELFLIFDGYGGAGIGDVAVNTIKENVKKFYLKLSEDQDATLPFFYSPKYLVEGNALINSILYTHNMLMKDNFSKKISERAGASGICVAKSESVLTLVSTGSCNAYIYRRGKLEKIFIEDSFQFLSNDDYEGHLKTMPLSGFGLFPDLYYQVKEIRLFKDDIVCLLTDGVYGRLKSDEIKDIISKPNKNLKNKLHELFELSNNRGNLDNQSGIILQF